ncbi:LPS export ABC transporter ATP-binding protein [Rickettsia endosymbiont of Cardiosporidium cionae]|uniref:LPS export ABC transporter ATP-binding protein n=1 Tax=Rickettsia endosymbiont of Cardiosporidium cionae TaxID=2777155 RepID=UPI0018949C34|nr:LPS export ABC transporter ATP-binding protein [Rickettsia endosymbiont of Cardiosporidium cionae]KAF8818418.1 LPS export ABC transporter ATP-binding protein [Rickettsia endosymbiont of Cardiosporidium cionae]
MYDRLLLKNISQSYEKDWVLDNVSLDLSQNEIVGLFGPNGSGKTTCFNVIAGLDRPKHGKVFFNDIDITYLPIYYRARLGISYLPQESSIFRGLSVRDNIRSILELSYSDKKKVNEYTDRLLDEFSIAHLQHNIAKSLSGGERRRLEIARALANNPKFIMLDEPFAAIDPISIGDVKQLVTKLRIRNIGVLITDHNIREVLDIVDRAYIIYNGNILMSGTSAEIKNDTKVKELYLGDIFL